MLSYDELCDALVLAKGDGWQWKGSHAARVRKLVAGAQLKYVGQEAAIAQLAEQVWLNSGVLEKETRDSKDIVPVVIGGPPGTGKCVPSVFASAAEVAGCPFE